MVPMRRRFLLLLALMVSGTSPLAPEAGAQSPGCQARPQEGNCPLAYAGRQAGLAIGASISEGVPERERTDIERHFSAVTDENAFKWSSMQGSDGPADYSATDALVEWARAADLRLRAHVLFWHRLQTPAWVKNTVMAAPDPPVRLRELMSARISEVMGRYRGRVAIYDVVNEPLELFGPGWDLADSALSKENFFYTVLGEDYIDHAFRAAHAADPAAKLALNETVWNPVIGDPKADAFLELVRRLKQRGVPIDSVGLQSHGMFGLSAPFFPESTASLKAYMDALGALGVTVEITELDVSMAFLRGEADPPGAQAKVFERVVLACAQSRHCTGVTTWNIRDSDSWLDTFWATAANKPNEPLLLDAAGNPKAAYAAVRSALLDRCRQPWVVRGRAATRPCSAAWPYLSPKLARPAAAWRFSKRTRTVTARVTSDLTVPFGVTATRIPARSNERPRSGRCLVSAGGATCTVRLSRGRWSVSVAAKLHGVAGSPASSRFRAR